ncbi:MAG: NAD(P)H-binding protein [Cardiobacteriaceae bacterium]|nr:NAD(P)H-binding protein [Cardiobacteriaceae bacterium]
MKRRSIIQFGLLFIPLFSVFQAKATSEKMNVLILGATGSLGKYVIEALLNKNPNIQLILYSRRSERLANYKSNPRIKIVEGDVLDTDKLKDNLRGINAVYAGLAGDLSNMANSLISAMEEAELKRLVWISSYGIYNEAGRGTMPPTEYIKSAEIIEKSNLNYTIIRPQWFSSRDEVDYEITHRNEKFKNPDAQISRKSIADLVAKCIDDDFGIRDSLGINKPAK